MRIHHLWQRLFVAAVLLATAICGCARPEPQQWPVNTTLVKNIRESLKGGETTAAAAARPDPTGFGTLTGSFRFAAADLASLPAPKPLDLSGDDAAFCAREGKPMGQSLLFDKSTGAVENVVIYLAEDLSKVAKPDLWVAPSAKGKTDQLVFDQDRCMFLSHVSALQVTQPMLIKNSDDVGHNTNLASSNPFNQIISPGGQVIYQHRVEERAPYKVGCNIHPWMTAYILPRDNGYFAVTGTDGTFTIADLPAGVPLTMKVWHEKVGVVSGEVTVNGNTAKWTKKGFQLEAIPTGGEAKLDVVFNADPFK
jgi:hypothetical protein